MQRTVKYMAVTAAALALSLPCRAMIEDQNGRGTNYRPIVDRNAFGLRPPPEPAPPAPPPAPVVEPKSDIVLTGISSFGRVQRAYLMSTEKQKGKTDYYALRVDEETDGLRVLEINAEESTVRIQNGGVETLLSFATHGVASGTAAPGLPGGPAQPGTVQPVTLPGQPGGTAGLPQPNAQGYVNPLQQLPAPAGATPLPALPGASAAAGNPMGNTLGNNQGVRTIPSRTIRSPQGDYVQPVNNFPGGALQMPERVPSLEEQVITIEAQRMMDPRVPPSPIPLFPQAPGE